MVKFEGKCEGMIIISLDLNLFEVGSIQDQGSSLFLHRSKP